MGLLSKIGYSAGSVTAALPQYAIQTYIFYYYLSILHMNEFWLATALSIWAVWNAVNDPIFGYLSDRTHSRWGRRRPWIAAFAIPLAFSTFLVFGPPGNAYSLGDFYLFVWLTLSIIFYDTCYTIVVLNWTALMPEMFATNRERSQVSVMRQTFSVFGLIAGTALPIALSVTIGWAAVGLAVGVMSTIFALVSLTGIREKKEFAVEHTLPPIAAMKHTFTNKSFVIFVVYNFIVQYVIAVAIGALPFFAQFILGDAGLTILLSLALFLVALPFFLLWNRINVRIGPRTSAIISMLWVGVCLVPILFVTNSTMAVVVIALAGAGVGGFMMMPDILISFTIDADELKTGVRREGAYFGFNAFVMRFAVVAQAWTYALILYASGFDELLPIQTDGALFAIRLLMSIVPALAILLGAAVISRYPYHGKTLDDLQRETEALHEQKRGALAIEDRQQ